MAEVLYLSKVRLSFPHLIEPQKNLDPITGKERITWSADLIVEPNSPNWKKFMDEVGKMAVTEWKEHAQQVLQMVQADRKSRCFGMGSEKIDKKTFKPYSGYDGMAYITAISNKQPQVIRADGTAVDASNQMEYQALTRKMYGGCYVNVAVKPWPQNNKHGRGVRCDFVAVQFAEDGQAFGEGNIDASSMFGAAAPAASAPAAPAVQMPGLPSFIAG